MDEDTTDWRQLHEFRGVGLTQSFILSWHCEGTALLVDIDLCLMPEHPFYDPPRRAGRACIRPAMLEFPECTQLSGGPLAARGDAVARVAATLGHGRIDDLRRVGEGRYRLSGAFGEVVLDAERPLLRLGDTITGSRGS